MHTLINVCIQHENIKWDEAPPWANFYAVDSDGDRWWYKNKPRLRFNMIGVAHWSPSDPFDSNCTYAPGYNLDDYYMYIFSRDPQLKSNRIYEDEKYILINDSKENQPWFTIFEKLPDYEFLEESSFYYFNDAIDYIWQKIKK